jgi:hypothetical protein
MRQSGNVSAVIRGPWRGTEEQERVMARLLRQVEKSRQEEDKIWPLVQEARRAGISDPVIARKTEIGRATINRKIGPRREADET